MHNAKTFRMIRIKHNVLKKRKVSFPLMHIHKPCSVPLRAAVIYLYMRTCLKLHFILSSSPTKFGFLACGVYLVPPYEFLHKLRHCDTLRASTMVKDFRFLLRRYHTVPDLIDSVSTNTTIIADRASMDFPLEDQRLPHVQ